MPYPDLPTAEIRPPTPNMIFRPNRSWRKPLLAAPAIIPIALKACQRPCHGAGRIKVSPKGEPKVILPGQLFVLKTCREVFDSREHRESIDSSLNENIVSEEKRAAVGKPSEDNHTNILSQEFPNCCVALLRNLNSQDSLLVVDSNGVGLARSSFNVRHS